MFMSPVASAALKRATIQSMYRDGNDIALVLNDGIGAQVLVQGPSKRDAAWLTGRTDTMKRVVFSDLPLPCGYAPVASQSTAARSHGGSSSSPWRATTWAHLRPQQIPTQLSCTGIGAAQVRAQPGDYVAVEVTAASAGTLTATALAVTTLQEFVAVHGSCNPTVFPHWERRGHVPAGALPLPLSHKTQALTGL